MQPRESGIVVPGEATSVSIVDILGDANPEVVVTTNDGPVFAFQRQ